MVLLLRFSAALQLRETIFPRPPDANAAVCRNAAFILFTGCRPGAGLLYHNRARSITQGEKNRIFATLLLILTLFDIREEIFSTV
jgi:hypothetical protein